MADARGQPSPAATRRLAMLFAVCSGAEVPIIIKRVNDPIEPGDGRVVALLLTAVILGVANGLIILLAAWIIGRLDRRDIP